MIRISLSHIRFNQGFEIEAGDSGRVSITVEGHAGYAEKGYDIVCSAVSVLSQTLVLTVDKIAGLEQKVDQHEGYLMTDIACAGCDREKIKTVKVLIDFFLIGISEIMRRYPETIEIKFI